VNALVLEDSDTGMFSRRVLALDLVDTVEVNQQKFTSKRGTCKPMEHSLSNIGLLFLIIDSMISVDNGLENV